MAQGVVPHGAQGGGNMAGGAQGPADASGGLALAGTTRPTWWAAPRLRTDAEQGLHRKVGWLELFYDLIFVAIVAQLSHRLAQHPDLGGFLELVLLFFPAFWMWIGGTFYTERFESDELSHRLAVLLQMFAIGAMAVFVHDATGETGQAFALSYAAGRALICLLWFRGGRSDPRARPVTDRYVAGFSVSVALFAASVLVDPPLRFALWGIGLVCDVATPLFTLRHQASLPRLSTTSRLPERFGLFVLIVLGEVMVAVINGVAEHEHVDARTLAHGALAMTVVFGFWWLYFDIVARRPAKPKLRWSMLRNYLHFVLLVAMTTLAAGVLHVLADDADVVDPHVAQLIALGAGLGFAGIALLHRTLDPPPRSPAWGSAGGMVWVAAVACVLVAFVPGITATQVLALLVAAHAIPLGYGATQWARGRIT